MNERKRPTFTDEFKREAVRLTLTSERTIRQVADDLGIGFSTLTKWKRKFYEADLLSGPMTTWRKNWRGCARRTPTCDRNVIC